MNNNEPRDTPITPAMIDAARARRLAYFADFEANRVEAPRLARRDITRNRTTSRRRRAIR